MKRCGNGLTILTAFARTDDCDAMAELLRAARLRQRGANPAVLHFAVSAPKRSRNPSCGERRLVLWEGAPIGGQFAIDALSDVLCRAFDGDDGGVCLERTLRTLRTEDGSGDRLDVLLSIDRSVVERFGALRWTLFKPGSGRNYMLFSDIRLTRNELESKLLERATANPLFEPLVHAYDVETKRAVISARALNRPGSVEVKLLAPEFARIGAIGAALRALRPDIGGELDMGLGNFRWWSDVLVYEHIAELYGADVLEAYMLDQ